MCVECRNCGALQPKAPLNAIVLYCADCVIEMSRENDKAILPTQRKIGYPRGWKFKKVFVHSDGTVYHKGVEQPDLKGSLPPTPIVQKQKKSRIQKEKEKQEILAQLQKLKTTLKRETRKTYAKKLQTQIKKLQRQL